MKISRMLVIALLALAGCTSEEDFTQYVNTKIGSGGHGHVFVGASVPFGLVQLGPTSIPQDWDWCSGYHDSDSTVIGFSHTHLEGTGVGDLFDITVMPVIGEVSYERGFENEPESGLWSYTDRSREISIPGYYSVPLTRYGILAEMTATSRVGIHRYTFPDTKDVAIVLDLENGGCWDSPTETHIEKISNSAIEGYRYSTGWAKDQRIYFYAEFSEPFDSLEIISKTIEGKPIPLYAKALFGEQKKGHRLMMKVALSPVSSYKASANMKAELPGWNFEGVAEAAKKAWNEELSKIRISTADEEKRIIFYTAMYHSMIQPSVFNDADGEYQGTDRINHSNEGFVNYTTLSLWDTYRAAMPLYSIIHPEKMNDIINTMLKIYQQQGKLPVWHLMGNETDCMVGNPGVIVVADAIVKGYDGFDLEKAFEALKTSAMLDERGQNIRKEYGFIPCDLYKEAIANDMEYAIADAAIANAADYLGKPEDAEFFRSRSLSYRNYMDSVSMLARGRFHDGKWRTPFEPNASNYSDSDYCEGNAWQYSWLAPQDFAGLVNFYGSKEKLVERLDTLFATSSDILGDDISLDMSGFIGQYVHGNEPSHHIIYFYTMAGAPEKAAEKVREVCNTMYFNAPDGLSGNEDVGQMSAWYILSSLGFYQVEPASTRFWFGSPLFDSADILTKGGHFIIKAENNSDQNIYIQSVSLNGKEYGQPWIDFKDIEKGGILIFKMGPKPHSSF